MLCQFRNDVMVWKRLQQQVLCGGYQSPNIHPVHFPCKEPLMHSFDIYLLLAEKAI